MDKEITMEKLIEDLDNLYGNDCFNYNKEQSNKLANDIRNLQKQSKEKQDKLDKIEKYMQDKKTMGYFIGAFGYGEFVNNVEDIIKGEVK